MPRKQNGWGTQGRGFAFGKTPTTIKGLRSSAAGNYPANRQFGTMVTRSVIEKWDMDSDWVKWRKGYEYYMQAAWEELVVPNELWNTRNRLEGGNEGLKPYKRGELNSVLYQGTDFSINTNFYGWRFPTSDADVNVHYVAKRVPVDKAELGLITEVFKDPIEDKEAKANKEIWVKGQALPNARLLLQMEGERLTDGETEATMKTVLTEEKRPAIYKGKTLPEDGEALGSKVPLKATRVKLEVPLNSVTQNPGAKTSLGETVVTDQGLRSYISRGITAEDVLQDPRALTGTIIYVPQFFVERNVDDLQILKFIDTKENPEYFGAALLDVLPKVTAYCLEPGQERLPPSMYDIPSLKNIFQSTECKLTISGTYIFLKQNYQRFFAPDSITGKYVEDVADTLSYAIMPFQVQAAYFEGDNIVIESVPFISEIKIHPALSTQAYIIFSDNSFCKYKQSKNEDGEDMEGWTDMDTDVDPWQDEVFITGKPVEPAVVYTCSCPNHSHSILAAPQSTEDLNTRKQNRQKRYPLPTVMSQDRWTGLGIDQAAGKVMTWDTLEHRLSLRLCKHAIAARFIDNIKVVEPNKYPSIESRLAFDKKLADEVAQFAYEFRLAYRRGGISVSEVVFSLAQGLNLDNVETAYVIFNSTS